MYLEKFSLYSKNKDKYRNSSREERAKDLYNVICPKCKYQNRLAYIKRYGKCHLCGATLDRDYFKNTLLRMCKNE